MSDDYASNVTKEALRSWERIKMGAVKRWGSLERLSSRVKPETAAKFASARAKYEDAKRDGEGFELARRCGVLERGIAAMEAEALDAGHAPADMCWFDLGVRVNEKRAVCVLSASDAEYVACQLQEDLGEPIVVYTAADIVLMAAENQTELHHLKHTLSAYTTSVNTSNGEAPW